MIELKTTHYLTAPRLINILSYIICIREKEFDFTKEKIICACKEYLRSVGTKGVDTDLVNDFKNNPNYESSVKKANQKARRIFAELFDKEENSVLFIKSLEEEKL